MYERQTAADLRENRSAVLAIATRTSERSIKPKENSKYEAQGILLPWSSLMGQTGQEKM